jgi:ABC-2 type transport system permease protein
MRSANGPLGGSDVNWRAMYWAIIRLSFQRQLTYRAANLAGLATNAFFGLLRASVLIALFAARDSVAGYTVRDAVTYTGLTQALLSYIAVFGWWDLMRTIRSGQVASDLSRPYDFFWYWWAQDVGRAAAQMLTRGLPIMLVYALVYRISLPPTLWHWAALAVSLFLALLASFGWRFLVSLSAFWTHDAVGVGRLAWMLGQFLSGFMMPIKFFPAWLSTLMRLTPFPTMLNTPAEVYLGQLSLAALPGALAVQLAWALLLALLCRAALVVALRKLVIQGG